MSGGLPPLRGNPCWVFSGGPFNLEERRRIRDKAGHRRFVTVLRHSLVPIFEFVEEQDL